MRCNNALVLGTVAVAHAAHIRHANFHSRRQIANVNWEDLAYDFSGVDWSKVSYSDGGPAPTPPAAPQPEPEPESVQTQPAPAPTRAPEPSSAPGYAPTSSEEKKPKQTEESNPLNDIMHGVSDFVQKLGIKALGQNSKTDNGKMWLGNSSPWTMEFTNVGDKDLKLFCWVSSGFTGMTLNVNAPAISINLAANGGAQNVSFAEGVPGACAPADESTVLKYGLVYNTWLEATFQRLGKFDVSRNVKMSGIPISAQGSKCLSDMENCVFKCTNGEDSCHEGNTYKLFECNAGQGGGGGYDPIMAGDGGGCDMGETSEHVRVSVG